MKKLRTIDIVVSIVALILVIAVATVLGALQVSGVIDLEVDTFLLIMTVLTLGIGLYLTVYAIIRKGGYEYAVGGILLVVGIILLMVCLKAEIWLILIVGVGISLIAMLVPFLLKAKSLVVERADEKEDFVPYMQKLEEQKKEEKEKEEDKPLPEIKSFKD
jgi:hypothetical protein